MKCRCFPGHDVEEHRVPGKFVSLRRDDYRCRRFHTLADCSPIITTAWVCSQSMGSCRGFNKIPSALRKQLRQSLTPRRFQFVNGNVYDADVLILQDQPVTVDLAEIV